MIDFSRWLSHAIAEIKETYRLQKTKNAPEIQGQDLPAVPPVIGAFAPTLRRRTATPNNNGFGFRRLLLKQLLLIRPPS